MGTVFTAEAVRDKEYPSPGAQSDVAHLLLGRLNFPRAIYGGTALRRFNRRGDVDLLIRTKDDVTAESLAEVSSHVQALEAEHHVEIDWHTLSDGEVENHVGRVAADPAFIGHLLYTAKNSGLVIGDPFAGLYTFEAYPEQQRLPVFATSMFSYAVNKRDSFLQAQHSQDPHDNYHALRRAFELPKKIGSKVMTMQQIERGDLPDMDDPDYYIHERSEAAVLSASGMYLSSLMLTALDNAYTQLLEKTINCEQTLEVYEIWLNTVSGYAIGKALDLSLAAARYALAHLPANLRNDSAIHLSL